MTSRTAAPPTGARSNHVRLIGRVAVPPEEVPLPSGDTVWTLRLVVPREESAHGRARSDTLECRVWAGRARRSVAGWSAGDVVEVTGSLRRRFFTAGAQRASRVEVEVAGGRLIRRADSG
jgi:single-strand DNA-binding protein